MLFPLHIATRGLLDGEYGIATRGYIICPDIVPRYPFDAVIEDLADDDGSFAVISEQDLEAILQDYPKLTFEASLWESDSFLVVTVDGEFFELEAAVDDLGLEAEVMAIGDVVGDASEPGLAGEVGTDSDIGDVSEEDERATVHVSEDDELIGEGGKDGDPTCS